MLGNLQVCSLQSEISNSSFCIWFSFNKWTVSSSSSPSSRLLWLILLSFSVRIYKYQAHGYAFSSVEELLHSLGGSGFINMTRRSLSESLLELGVSQRFIDEVIAPIMRVNYGQNISIPAFVGTHIIFFIHLASHILYTYKNSNLLFPFLLILKVMNYHIIFIFEAI